MRNVAAIRKRSVEQAAQIKAMVIEQINWIKAKNAEFEVIVRSSQRLNSRMFFSKVSEEEQMTTVGPVLNDGGGC